MPEPASPVCVRLKRDLRVTDHPAVSEAAARAQGRGRVHPLPVRAGSARAARLGLEPAKRASSFSNCRRPAASAGSPRETAGIGSGKSGWRRHRLPCRGAPATVAASRSPGWQPPASSTAATSASPPTRRTGSAGASGRRKACSTIFSSAVGVTTPAVSRARFRRRRTVRG
jgi:hypothetical protein